MYVKYHIIYGFLFALILYLVFPEIGLIEGLAFFFSSVLIDADHYAVYIYRKKDFDLMKAVKYFTPTRIFNMKKGYRSDFFFLHTIEALVVILVIAQFYSLFYFVFFGMLFHIITDHYADRPLKYRRIVSIIVWLTQKE